MARIPDAIANTVRLIVDDLRTQAQARQERSGRPSQPSRT
jgi:hypothetical protein